MLGRDYKRQRDSLRHYIEQLRTLADFNLSDWLKTLNIDQLQHIENDAIDCACATDCESGFACVAPDLFDIASMAYTAELRYEIEVDDESEIAQTILIGLAVAACLERLKRRGWIEITGKVELVLKEPRPYRITQRGLEEGPWSNDAMVLWILGNRINLH